MMLLNSSPPGRPELNCCSGSVLLPQDSSSLATRELAACIIKINTEKGIVQRQGVERRKTVKDRRIKQ